MVTVGLNYKFIGRSETGASLGADFNVTDERRPLQTEGQIRRLASIPAFIAAQAANG